ncbi:TnsD family Tn7-like transposition protein [Bacillus sp. FJAT-22090]|uniref:TnsD family Tn7-like transposition protein n=1 Tax=Bacillus sp. FJAT-22090 TaxID=1581038 RepID=UPI0016431BB1|nr:TnsD family Tn7-like transposition protein [Bacillus sp. FJAT-22090]
MIGYFPCPYKDETIYSIAARYANHTGALSKNAVLLELFDIQKPMLNEEYLSKIDILVSKINHFSNEYTLHYFLSKHSSSPLYTPFINNKIHNTAVALEFHLKSKKKYKWDVPSKDYLYYCSKCVQQSIDRYGESYWNRVFQVPGVMVCSKHARFLDISQINIVKNPINKFILPIEDVNKLEGNDNTIIEQLIEIASNIEYFFNNEVKKFNFKQLYEKYFEFIKIAGIATPKSTLKSRLGELIISKFNEETLDILNSNPRNNKWLSYLSIERIKHIHPVRHVLLMMTLSESVESFINTSPQYLPFGSGPWVCMNPLSDHYLDKTISEIEVIFNDRSGKFRADFICSCGFTYTLNTGESNPLSINKFSRRVKKKGMVWEREFDKLVSDGITVKELAKKIKQSRNTVQNIIKKGHRYLENEKREKQKQLNDKRKKQEKEDREKWVEIFKNHPNYSRTELNDMYGNLYNRLLVRDKEWLEKNTPASKRGRSKYSEEIYQKEDLLKLEEARHIFNNWSTYEQQAGNIIKMTRNTFYKRLRTDLRNKDNYPLTDSFISSILESVSDYQIRLIHQCMERHYQNVEVKKYELIALTGIRAKILPEIHTYIEKIIREHNEI